MKRLILSSMPEILILTIGLGGTTYLGIETYKYNKIKNSELMQHNKYYNIDDLYIVYNNNDIWYCHRNVTNIYTKYEEQNNEIYGYRGLEYGYYDIKSGEKICEDFDSNFYIESLLDICYENEIYGDNYIISIDSIEKEVTVDTLLSREPEPMVLVKKQ